MSNSAEGDDLFELPAEFEGLPYSVKAKALQDAEATIPRAAIVAHLGTAHAEIALKLAAAHILATRKFDDGSGPGPLLSVSITGVGWDASPYGQRVALILAQLPRASGRGRSVPVVV